MKTLNIKEAEIEEVIFRPNDPSNSTLSVAYILKDENGNVIFRKRTVIKREDLPAATLTALTNFTTKVLNKVESFEAL